LNVPCYSLANLIERAYGQFADGRENPVWAHPKVEGGPSWVRSDFYGINAKADSTAGRVLMNGTMLRNLLEERFKLKLHRESRVVPVYALTVSKSGPKLRRAKEGSCVPFDPSSDTNPLAPAKGVCVTRSWQQFGVNSRTVEVQAANLKMIGWLLGSSLDRPVIDRTGLTGTFDAHMEFAPDQTTLDPTRGPSIFTAVQEELGLKLEPSKGPGEFLVIDHAERPSEN
jgi:uncharacterized protein (TIGR03435 family)